MQGLGIGLGGGVGGMRDDRPWRGRWEEARADERVGGGWKTVGEWLCGG